MLDVSSLCYRSSIFIPLIYILVHFTAPRFCFKLYARIRLAGVEIAQVVRPY